MGAVKPLESFLDRSQASASVHRVELDGVGVVRQAHESHEVLIVPGPAALEVQLLDAFLDLGRRSLASETRNRELDTARLIRDGKFVVLVGIPG
ncbi:MAG TPA: hypothetical protein DC063_13975 [Arenimonas sp.]|nr:hypothetical protein [Arenimonas sp.]